MVLVPILHRELLLFWSLLPLEVGVAENGAAGEAAP